MLILVNVHQFHTFIPVGWYEEEIKTTTEVWIDVSVAYEAVSINEDLNQTIDYAEIHRILNHVSKKAFRLLESFGEEVLKLLEEQFGHLILKESTITINKGQILEKGSDVGSQSVTLKKQYP